MHQKSHNEDFQTMNMSSTL